MRNISAASLATLQQTSGVEPVIVVRVYWGGTTHTNYCDRKFSNNALVGKLLSISGIEDVIDINAAASSVNLSVSLDDSDGSIKHIFDHNDIHKTRVQILQWFSNLPFTAAFVIFEGEIASPITWSEGARSLDFQVLSQLEEREIGFSAEEGKFDFLPENLVGQAWPIVFGTVAGSKLLSITEPASCILASGFAIVDHDIWEAELADLSTAITAAAAQERDAYQLSLNNAFIAGAFKPFGGFLPDDPSLAEQYDNASADYYRQANEYAVQRNRLTLEYQAKLDEYELQKSYEFRVLPITATNLPVGVQLTVEIGNYTATAVVIGNQIVISNLIEKRDVNQRTGTNNYFFGTQVQEFQRTSKGQKFNWIDGGTTVKVFGLPKYYIASLGEVTVLNVWAKSKFGRAVVPRNWYTVEVVNYNGLIATRIIFPTPITSYPGEWEDGDIEIDCTSAVGSNTVDIMLWAINNFSTLGYDTTSFAYTRIKVDPFPANFVLTERKDIVHFLQEVAFQSRCAIWINDRKFYLRFLPEELVATDTLTDDDIEVNTVIITATDTERLVTKFIANWKSRVNQSKANQIIYRYNIKRYGVHEENYDFYIYNQISCVMVAAQFWMIRKSSSWKRVQCKALLHKLRIETFDPVEFNFTENLVADEPVTGIIEKAVYNPDENVIVLEAWLPVRLGEMHKYTFAYPFDVQVLYPNEADPNLSTGNPFDQATGELAPENTFPPYTQLITTKFNPFTSGRDEIIADSAFETPGNVVFALDPREVNQTRPNNIEAFNNEKKYEVKPLVPFVLRQPVPASFYGTVQSRVGDTQHYSCLVYLNGLSNNATLTDVLVTSVPDGDSLPTEYPLVVTRNVYVAEDESVVIEFWAQPPLWVPYEAVP